MARPKSMHARKMISLPAELAQQVDDFRFRERIKTEAEAIRRLIEMGLAAEDQVQAALPILPESNS